MSRGSMSTSVAKPADSVDLMHHPAAAAARLRTNNRMSGPNDEAHAPLHPDLPPPSTWRALAEQNTEAMRTEAQRYASSRLRYIRGAGLPLPQNYARELVEDAISDTWAGIAKWIPSRCSLLVHLRGEILDRTSKELRRARRFPRIPLDIAAADPIDGARVEPVSDPTTSGDCPPVLLASLMLELVTALSERARGDRHAEAMLACWRDFVIDRDEVIDRTEMTDRCYKATRKRLVSLSTELSAGLRELARELLRSAS